MHRGALRAAVHAATELDTTERLSTALHSKGTVWLAFTFEVNLHLSGKLTNVQLYQQFSE